MIITVKTSRTPALGLCSWPTGGGGAQMESEHMPSPCTFCWTNSYNLIMTFNVWDGGFYILLRRHCWLLCVVLPVYTAMQIIPGGEFTNCTSIINRVMIFSIPLLSLLLVSYIIHAGLSARAQRSLFLMTVIGMPWELNDHVPSFRLSLKVFPGGTHTHGK